MGIYVWWCANHLLFKVEGRGIIAGVANADMKDTDPYAGYKRKAWHRRAMVVIKSTRNAGDIKLTVTSPDLSKAILDIKTFGHERL